MTQTTYYVRDAAGSVMAIYNNTTLTEHPIYGSGRLGIYFKQNDVSVYQLTDHLGNVRAVVGVDGLTGATDYYPFGMIMPGRNLQDANGYRYAYQGQEKDPETGKEAFELRLWDSRIGRWLNPDPYGVHHSPYLGMANNPTGIIDRDGGIPIPIITGAIGAIINAGVNIYSQYKEGTLDFSSGKTWARIGVAAGGGFVAGATGNLGVAVAANTVGDVADQLIVNDGDFSQVNITQSAVAGASTFVGGKLGGQIARNSFVKAQAREIHTRMFSRKFTTYTGKTISGTSKTIGEINRISLKNTTEVFGGLATGGFFTQISPEEDYIRKFNLPNLNDIYKDFSREQHGQSFFNMFRNSSFTVSMPSVEVGQGCFCNKGL